MLAAASPFFAIFFAQKPFLPSLFTKRGRPAEVLDEFVSLSRKQSALAVENVKNELGVPYGSEKEQKIDFFYPDEYCEGQLCSAVRAYPSFRASSEEKALKVTVTNNCDFFVTIFVPEASSWTREKYLNRVVSVAFYFLCCVFTLACCWLGVLFKLICESSLICLWPMSAGGVFVSEPWLFVTWYTI